MFSRVRDRFGTAGLAVAIVALIAALAGTAYAASALNGKQKKEVEKIAKKYAGKPGKDGTNGTNGSNGAAGAKGDKGDAGAPGAPGGPGANGKSVVIGATAPGCGVPGGKTIEVAGEAATKQNICNGKEGSPWTAGGVLPTGKTEVGSWAGVAEPSGPGAFVALPFFLPLPAALDAAHVIQNPENYNGEDEVGAAHENCPGKASNPRAKAGFLCVYIGSALGTSGIETIFDPVGGFSATGASKAGAALVITNTSVGDPAFISGTYAVTAP